MIRLLLLTGALALGTSAVSPVGDAAPVPTHAPAPRRIVSLNLCADQLLVPLTDRNRIAALNMNARDRWMSAVAGQAQGYRTIRGSLEEILALDPDLIVGPPPGRMTALHSLGGRAVRAVDLPPANSYAEIRAQIRDVAAATGDAARGAWLVSQMDAALARVARVGQGRVAAYYQRRGFLTGSGTLVDDLMARVGLANLATRLNKPPLSRLSLEEMVAAQPDLLVVEQDSQLLADQGSEALAHPALRHIPRIVLPQAWTLCGGPAYVLAARSLSDQLAALGPVRP